MDWKKLIGDLAAEKADIELGGGQRAIERQHKKGRLTARERIKLLLDSCLLYTSPSPRDQRGSRMPSSA